jgi:transposase InsO family protein
LVLEHRRREVLHFNVTDHPTSLLVAQQIVEAFAEREGPHYLIRDRDRVYGIEVRQRLSSLGIEEVLTAPRSPWQNAYAERLIGSILRESEPLSYLECSPFEESPNGLLSLLPPIAAASGATKEVSDQAFNPGERCDHRNPGTRRSPPSVRTCCSMILNRTHFWRRTRYDIDASRSETGVKIAPSRRVGRTFAIK